jgi:uncharacterized membrane-anchored protein
LIRLTSCPLIARQVFPSSAGLVAAVLDTKVASKLGLLAAVAVFAKKFWFLLFVPLAFGWRWLKRLFTGNRTA